MQFQLRHFDTFDMVVINEMVESVTFTRRIFSIAEQLDEVQMQQRQIEREIEVE